MLSNPLAALSYLAIRLKGIYYKEKYKILNKNVTIGKRFKVKKSISIKGPGIVIIGDDVFIDGSMHAVTPWTYAREAKIIIGNRVFLNGTRFGCSEKISIGDDSIIADCRIMDTDFHSLHPKHRNESQYVQKAPVMIGKNVWIAMDAVVLKGVTIGDNSTIAARSVVYNDIPELSVYGGNPAVFIKKVPID